MSEPTAIPRNKKRRRAIFLSLSLLAVFAAGGLVFSIVEKIRDAADRIH